MLILPVYELVKCMHNQVIINNTAAAHETIHTCIQYVLPLLNNYINTVESTLSKSAGIIILT